ncbi:N-acetylmuramoyl-L-alanine amidase family protein [Winogradskyella immobilis]|uniref:N-acetylmuramoyl-L-alanine amidase n=1 Tax=Winogradskyella immobilis TaxID=2816852 RepID=A0ABS8ER61_9FLAO|nr:N-acetylmuramoyl-L-alanine amidase [Winogradskyella immobilis]MCC1485347.1 N-acetylmuramoyl-L-alanine amidase [Winogradskyella immobilis]MCG0017439.1 N-acetylmuramoyl-L-alanine amidase [Winogradskyella immobilis]
MKTHINYILVFLVVIFSIGLTPKVKAQSSADKFIVVLDAGHGDGDPGNLGNGYKEKDIALKVVLALGRELEKDNKIKVMYTRKTDVFLELHERADIANKADADLFVSIHCNSVSNSKPYGTETFVLGAKNSQRNFEVAKKENEVIFLEKDYEQNYAGFDPRSPESTIAIGIEQEIYVEQSIVLARKIEDNFVNVAKRKSRGLKQASLLVIRNTYMPSVLVELGFLTNKREGAYLNSKAGQTKMANSIKEAILSYKNEIDQNVGDRFVIDNSKTVVSTDSETEETTSQIIKNVHFKIQISASSKRVATKSYNFKGLNTITREKQGDLYKYFYGNTQDYNIAKTLKEEAKNKGYSTCFIVAYKNGKKVSVDEALKSASN